MVTNHIKCFLLTCFFFSGATSLSLEVAWAKELSYLLGVDLYASTTVVTAFMAGLGLGAILVARFFRWSRASIAAYAVLQIAIGICGLFSIPLFRSTLPLFSFLYSTVSFNNNLFLPARFLVVFALMMIPVTLMGMTLPVIVGVSFRKIRMQFAPSAGLFYGINTLGAVTGTLLAGFFLIPRLGILSTCMLTGSIDLLIGVFVFWLHKETKCSLNLPTQSTDDKAKGLEQPQSKQQPLPSFWQRYHSLVGLLFLLSGMAALTFEICWFRLLSRIIGPSIHAFSIMLAVYLFGIGLGSVFGSRWIKKVSDHRFSMGLLLFTTGIGTLMTMFLINSLPIWYGRLFLFISQNEFSVWHLAIQATIAGLLILPATISLGVLFPIVVKAYNEEIGLRDHRVEPSVGRLYFLNTLGGVAGCLMCGFWLLPKLGIDLTLILASGLSIVLAATVFFTARKGTLVKKLLYSSLSLIVGAMLIITLPERDHYILNAGIYSEIRFRQFKENAYTKKSAIKETPILFRCEGINNVVVVKANLLGGANLTLHLSGHWVASTLFPHRLHLHLLGHLPMIFAQQCSSAAVIGFGTGITSGTLLQYPKLQRLDILEIEPGVMNASKYFDYINHSPLSDSRSRLIMIDGRSHFTYNTTTYDVITCDPNYPFIAGSSNLYTKEFYEIVSSRLNEGGIFCQWIPIYGISPQSYNTILLTIHRVFPHMALFVSHRESIVLASEKPIRISWDELERRFYSKGIFENFEAIDIKNPYKLVAYFIGEERQIDEFLTDLTHINTDNNVWLEHRMPMDYYDLTQKGLERTIVKQFQKDRLASLQQIVPGIPIKQFVQHLSTPPIKRDHLLYNLFKKAEKAHWDKDPKTEEKCYQMILENAGSHLYHWYAGFTYINLLLRDKRTNEALAISRLLQKKFPARGEPYEMESAILNSEGRKKEAGDAVRRGLLFNPNHPGLLNLEETQKN